MSERYSRLFTLPENLYAVGSPVVIAAGTLLKDNQTGKIVAQLKLRSISNKAIKAVKVSLSLFDTAGNPIGNVVEYEYLDLDVSRDTEFGQKNPVFVIESKARSYEVAVTEVVFSDRSVWSANTETWEPLSRPVPLKISDPELLKQYKIRFGNSSTYEPKEEKDLWYCTCGELNRTGESCHCGNSLFELQTVDMDALDREKQERLIEEARQEAEEKTAIEAAKRKRVKILKIILPVTCVVIAFAILLNAVIIPNSKYKNAVSLMDAGQYEEAIAAFEALDGYKDSVEQIVKCEDALVEGEKAAEYRSAEEFASNGEYAKAAIAFAKMDNYRDSKQRCLEFWENAAMRDTIAAGFFHTVGLKNDGTVVAVGANSYGQCDVSDWSDIIAVSAGRRHTVGLKSDGTVVAVGDNEYNQCDVDEWQDIVAISAGYGHTVGLKIDGTVVAVGSTNDGECDIGHWSDIVAISAGSSTNTVGLKSDGTVVAAGWNEHGQCNTANWKNIVAIQSGGGHTVALKADGTVLAIGLAKNNRCNVSNWSNIVAISAEASTIGLTENGTVVMIGNDTYKQSDVSKWSEIIAISSKNGHTAGLKANGTVVAVGFNEYGQCDVSSWKDIKLPN